MVNREIFSSGLFSRLRALPTKRGKRGGRAGGGGRWRGGPVCPTERTERTLGRQARHFKNLRHVHSNLFDLFRRIQSYELQETRAGAWAYVLAMAAAAAAAPPGPIALPRASERGGGRPVQRLCGAAVCPRPPRVFLPRKLSLSPRPPLQNSSVPQAGSRSTSSLIPTFLPPLPLPSSYCYRSTHYITLPSW